MGGRGASSSSNSTSSFIKDLAVTANITPRGDLQGAIEAYAMQNKLNAKQEDEIMTKLEKEMKKPAKVVDNVRGFEVYNKVPEGWSYDEGVTTAPRGYIAIQNNKPRFSGKRDHKTALVKVR